MNVHAKVIRTHVEQKNTYVLVRKMALGVVGVKTKTLMDVHV
jgi:hypothetical protein